MQSIGFSILTTNSEVTFSQFFMGNTSNTKIETAATGAIQTDVWT